MSRNTISIEVYKDALEYCHWVEKRQLLLLFTGQEAKRHSRTEKVLRRLCERGKVRAVKYGKRLVYALPRKTKKFNEFEGMAKIYHGLASTECLVRAYRAKMEGEIIAERFF